MTCGDRDGVVFVSPIHGVRLVVGQCLVVLTAEEARALAVTLVDAAASVDTQAAAVVEAPARPVSWS